MTRNFDFVTAACLATESAKKTEPGKEVQFLFNTF